MWRHINNSACNGFFANISYICNGMDAEGADSFLAFFYKA